MSSDFQPSTAALKTLSYIKQGIYSLPSFHHTNPNKEWSCFDQEAAGSYHALNNLFNSQRRRNTVRQGMRKQIQIIPIGPEFNEINIESAPLDDLPTDCDCKRAWGTVANQNATLKFVEDLKTTFQATTIEQFKFGWEVRVDEKVKIGQLSFHGRYGDLGSDVVRAYCLGDIFLEAGSEVVKTQGVNTGEKENHPGQVPGTKISTNTTTTDINIEKKMGLSVVEDGDNKTTTFPISIAIAIGVSFLFWIALVVFVVYYFKKRAERRKYVNIELYQDDFDKVQYKTNPNLNEEEEFI